MISIATIRTHCLSLRNKVIAGFMVLLLLIGTGMGLMLWQGARLTHTGTSISEQYQPVMLLSLRQMQDINQATAELNGYLLTGHSRHKNRYQVLVTVIEQRLGELRTLLNTKLNKNDFSNQQNTLNSINNTFAEFHKLAQRLIYLHDHPNENYPGLAIATDTLNPLHLEYMGIINGLLSEVQEIPTSSQQTQLLVQLVDIRYTWSQMINSVRVFLSTRVKRDLDNIRLYMETNGQQLQNLAAKKIELGFGDVERLLELHAAYQKNLPVVSKIFLSDRWRADIHLMNTRVSEVTESLRQLLQKMANEQVDASHQASGLLLKRLTQAEWLGLLILVASLVVGGIISMVVVNGTAPIAHLAHYARSVSLDDPQDVDPVLRERRDEVGELASAFSQMIGRLTDSYCQVQDVNEVLEQRVSERTAQLVQKADELASINAELNQFAYIVSHDLKAPLRAIANLSEWIEDDLQEVLTDDTRKQMTLLRSRAARMDDLIHGILKYSRVGHIDNEVENVDVKELIAEIIAGLVVPKGFVIDIDPNMPVFETARVPLSQVFANLLSNAIKYHQQPDQGHVQISVREVDDEYYEFCVADDGPGIAPKYHDKVFGIFQTLNARDDVESTGVGLSIVKKIVETQGGEIKLDSAEGKGSSFRFSVPKRNIGISQLSNWSVKRSAEL